MASTGIRQLKNNLSRFVRRIEAGERITVTAHGRVVAQLVPPGKATKGRSKRYDELVDAGVIRPAIEARKAAAWPDIHLPQGSARALIDTDRGEA